VFNTTRAGVLLSSSSLKPSLNISSSCSAVLSVAERLMSSFTKLMTEPPLIPSSRCSWRYARIPRSWVASLTSTMTRLRVLRTSCEGAKMGTCGLLGLSVANLGRWMQLSPRCDRRFSVSLRWQAGIG
jgi:hypothetical protein